MIDYPLIFKYLGVLLGKALSLCVALELEENRALFCFPSYMLLRWNWPIRSQWNKTGNWLSEIGYNYFVFVHVVFKSSDMLSLPKCLHVTADICIDHIKVVLSLWQSIAVGDRERRGIPARWQCCVKETFILHATNYEISKWVASFRLTVCLRVSGGVEFELQRCRRNDNSQPTFCLRFSLFATSHIFLTEASLVVQTLCI